MRTFSSALAAGVVVFSVATPARAVFYTLQRVVSGLNQPTYVTQAPNDNTNLYVCERAGSGSTLGDIVKYNPVTKQKTTFLDLSGQLTQDGGVLSMTFHPDFATNGLFYVTTLSSSTNFLTEYKYNSVTGTVAPSTRANNSGIVLMYPNPATQHTIDWVGFKPTNIPGATAADHNTLYVTTGDGGIQADSSNGSFANNPSNAQNTSLVLGKTLRINVDPAAADAYPSDQSKNFAIPTDNPYVSDNTGKLKELFEIGRRNPWRASFDRSNGDFYVGEVGFNTKEEVDFNKNDAAFNSGKNYGWASREGTIQTPVNGVGGAKDPTWIDPIYQVDHPDFKSITGGYVYRGPIPELQGKYIFGDFNGGKVRAFDFDRNTATTSFNGATGGISNVLDLTTSLNGMINGVSTLTAVVSFGEDNAGNLYIVDLTNPGGGNIFNPTLGTGEIFELVPTPEPTSAALLAICAATLIRRRRAESPRTTNRRRRRPGSVDAL